MAQFKTFEDGVEVKGETVLAFINGTPMERTARQMLAENGIEDPQPEEWYLQQSYLDAFAEVADSVGENTVNRIGKKIPEDADWPPGIDSVVGGLESVNEAYQMNHRGGEIGSYDAEAIDETTVQITCNNPYPCVFDRGLLKATAEQFVDRGVARVDEVGDSCRNEGGTDCVYEVTW
ncbi:hypothetical protein ACFQJ7_12455 [Halovenus rubra]|uniref:4-vinyl reductase 4VR domain-containing protein n=2 Tax=Halovenus rubra TaxID=869890 RepID=A0ABD5X6T7_9EURY|nr:hypothetical protein [Halovenus rubra]